MGAMTVTIYGHQPLLRLESFAFERGPNAVVPGVISADVSQREFRAGLGLSAPIGPFRAGVAGEWSQRSDEYDLVEQSGSPESGTRRNSGARAAFR
jgi:hypothetical protein